MDCERVWVCVRVCGCAGVELGCSDTVIKEKQTLILMRFFYNYQCVCGDCAMCARAHVSHLR